MAALSVSAVLSQAADLVAKGWVKGVLARSKNGLSVEPTGDSPTPCHFCALGAIAHASYRGGVITHAGISAEALAQRALTDVIRDDISDWNDAVERRQRDVVAALRKAAVQVTA
jgi:hypothetical protein